ncbi:hypothetical protein QYE76_020019 [Lolium multiflorum]|uniref:F-box domain-containing protein n=1 Tax=Lolium multiflorum TaxID=4521 RepID=A0AAD8R675_LOLMU|nr:hypothetical protein QYE76_020019 [Lolium multiflorum]
MSPPNSPERRCRRRRRRLSSPTAAAMPAPAVSMADDLVFDVFSRLPVKSLCRFRCVSRGWHALISDPAFLAAHRARHTEPHFVVADHFGGLRVIDMDANVVSKVRDVSCSRVLSTSMDDLICLTKCRNDFAQVMDPATGKVLMYWPKQHDLPHMLGFGRAVPSGAYKIVYLGRDCMVLTLGDDIGWRVAPSPPGHQGQNLSSTIVVNGVIDNRVRHEVVGRRCVFHRQSVPLQSVYILDRRGRHLRRFDGSRQAACKPPPPCSSRGGNAGAQQVAELWH